MVKKFALITVFAVLGAIAPGTALVSAQDEAVCGEVLARVKKLDKKMSRELRQIKRDLVVMRQAGEETSFKDVVGGVGYILGLFGAAAFVASRKERK